MWWKVGEFYTHVMVRTSILTNFPASGLSTSFWRQLSSLFRTNKYTFQLSSLVCVAMCREFLILALSAYETFACNKGIHPPIPCSETFLKSHIHTNSEENSYITSKELMKKVNTQILIELETTQQYTDFISPDFFPNLHKLKMVITHDDLKIFTYKFRNLCSPLKSPKKNENGTWTHLFSDLPHTNSEISVAYHIQLASLQNTRIDN